MQENKHEQCISTFFNDKKISQLLSDGLHSVNPRPYVTDLIDRVLIIIELKTFLVRVMFHPLDYSGNIQVLTITTN